MATSEIHETYSNLPAESKGALLALSVLIDRIGTLPKVDRDELFDLLQEWRKANDHEEQESIRRAMEEIIAQRPIQVRPLEIKQASHPTRGNKAWAEHVGKKIRQAREGLGLTQNKLAEISGIPQSHISRLENAEHSASHLTLAKLAKALGIEVRDLDACAE